MSITRIEVPREYSSPDVFRVGGTCPGHPKNSNVRITTLYSNRCGTPPYLYVRATLSDGSAETFHYPWDTLCGPVKEVHDGTTL